MNIMGKNNGLPKDISETEDGQHIVLINPILEISSEMSPSSATFYLRRPATINEYGYFFGDFYGVRAVLVLLGTYPGKNRAIPQYYRIARGDLTSVLSLLSIVEGKTIAVMGGKIIDIF